MQGRSASMQLTYNNVSITADLQRYLKSFTYTDNMSGQSDDLQIVLDDRDDLWLNSWFPEKGAVITPTIIRKNWTADGEVKTLSLGKFEVDEPAIGGPPSEVTIKALSIPEGSATLRGEQKSNAWERTTLSKIASTIAGKNGMKFIFDSTHDPSYDRLDQSEQTDLAFLQDQCGDAGLDLKIAEGRIIIFDAVKYEAAAPIATITRGKSEVISYSGRTTLNEIYKACTVKYTDSKTKKTYMATYDAQNAPSTGKVLTVNQRVTSFAEAKALAKRKLRQANSKETIMNVTIPGDTKYIASMTVQLDNFGKFSGKYIINQAIHRGCEYTTTLQLYRVLEGY
jgi:phage protein D